MTKDEPAEDPARPASSEEGSDGPREGDEGAAPEPRPAPPPARKRKRGPAARRPAAPPAREKDDEDDEGDEGDEGDEAAARDEDDEGDEENEAAAPAKADVPAFAAAFPSDPVLDELVAAFERGNYARVRREAPALAKRADRPEVRKAARELARHLEPDPLAVYLILAASLLLAFLAIWYWTHPHGAP